MLINYSSYAKEIGLETGLELPRYVSLKSNESNIRVGPSKNYPIIIKYIKKDFPLKIVDEHKEWRKTVDFQNNTGWIHKSLIKGQRNGILISQNQKKIQILNTVDGKIIGEANTGTFVRLSKCKVDWCMIVKHQYRGWVKKKYLWGVKENEKFNLGFFQIFTDNFYKSINFIENFIS
tara:strand:+ start:126 stop:656 length:531 start_codon:yes stop_codon:yes gene_type:complete